MTTSNKPDLATIAEQLTGGPPMDFVCHPDNTLVIIAHNGKKFSFQFEEYKHLLNPPKPAPKPKKPPSTKK